jgi:hypothetical protein
MVGRFDFGLREGSRNSGPLGPRQFEPASFERLRQWQLDPKKPAMEMQVTKPRTKAGHVGHH